MQEASMTGLVKTLAIILVVYYSFKLVGRYILPLFIKRTMNKMEERFKAQQEAQQPQQKVGEISIDKKPKTQKKVSDKGGEYIDYEEIE